MCEGCDKTIVECVRMSADESEVIAFLQRHGCFLSERVCSCGHKCKYNPKELRFRCRKRSENGVICNISFQLRKNTFFAQSKLSVYKKFEFIIFWLSIAHPRQDLIIEELNVSTHVVVDWSGACRDVCTAVLLDRSYNLGGPGISVQIVEAKCGKKTNIIGRQIGPWVYGCFERETKKCFLETVANRTSEALISLIRKRILPGSRILMDYWRKYGPLLSDEDHEFLKINHSVDFLDPHSLEVKNTERMWRDIRIGLPRCAKGEEHFLGYLAEQYWKRQYVRIKRLHYFLIDISTVYPPH